MTYGVGDGGLLLPLGPGNSGPGGPMPDEAGPSPLDPLVLLAVHHIRTQAHRQNLDDVTRTVALGLLRSWAHAEDLSAAQRVTVALHFRSAGDEPR